jgi:hypothetical protein
MDLLPKIHVNYRFMKDKFTLKLSISDNNDRLCIFARNNVASSLEPKFVNTIVCSSSISSVTGGHSYIINKNTNSILFL